jgi:hypothetical protein
MREMRETLNDPHLEDALIPDWAVGCRRLAPDTGYLKVRRPLFHIQTSTEHSRPSRKRMFAW